MQAQLVVGDSFNVLNTFAKFPASEGWTLKTRFTPRSPAAAAVVLTAVAEDDDFRTTANSGTTASWAAGDYSVAQWVEKPGQRITVATGDIKLLPDPAMMAAGTDTRSHLEKVIANIEAMLEGKTTKDVQEYTIADRQLKHIPIPELIVLKEKYQAQLSAEKRANGVNKRPGLGKKIHLRF